MRRAALLAAALAITATALTLARPAAADIVQLVAGCQVRALTAYPPGAPLANVTSDISGGNPRLWFLIPGTSDFLLFDSQSGERSTKATLGPADDAAFICLDADATWDRGRTAGTLATPHPPSPTPTTTPVPPPSGASAVKVAAYVSQRSQTGMLQFMGELLNVGSAEVASVNVKLTLVDSDGSEILTADAVADPLCLSPGERGAFLIPVPNPPATWANERLEPSWSPRDASYDRSCYESFSVSGVSIVGLPQGGFAARGQVANVGSSTATRTKVVFVGYDTVGRLTVVSSTFAEIDPLPAGGTSPFEVPLPDLEVALGSHRFIVNASVQ